VLVEQERRFGSEDRRVLMTKYNVACCLRDGRQFVEAEAIFVDVATGLERLFGAEHLDTLYARYCLAMVVVRQGLLLKARAMLTELLKVLELLQPTLVHHAKKPIGEIDLKLALATSTTLDQLGDVSTQNSNA